MSCYGGRQGRVPRPHGAREVPALAQPLLLSHVWPQVRAVQVRGRAGEGPVHELARLVLKVPEAQQRAKDKDTPRGTRPVVPELGCVPSAGPGHASAPDVS